MADITIVLIPGLVSDARVWKGLADVLAERHAIYDGNVQRDDRIKDMAGRLLQEVGSDIVAIGHSMGGRVAMEMAHQAPGRVRALVLSNTGHDAKKPGEEVKRQLKVDLAHQDMAKLAAEWVPPMLGPSRIDDQAIIADLTDMVVSIGPEVHERQIKALLARPNAAAYLPLITCPVLLLTGAQDSWSPEPQHREIADLAPDAELHVIDRAGHFLPMEQTTKTVETITRWMERRWEDIHVE
ncbi:alpha/beta fold hydrolase [Pseudorhizobium pelagicum]|uniref:Alpha/beta hydrolase n=1 Tax=Pseudorhizobium pelagicum TaxID=1509405 RepID=A0A922NYG1_9HYPH|nr:alpha/beta hydrolase [Pseudorhizobium pelagicum]KEQ04412.1 alpha/beta hydrolase [Pseudorhizobium pelagicum]